MIHLQYVVLRIMDTPSSDSLLSDPGLSSSNVAFKLQRALGLSTFSFPFSFSYSLLHKLQSKIP